MNNFSRAASAFVLMASMLAGSVAAVGQTTTQKPAEPPPDVPVLKKTPAQTDAAKTTQPSTTAATADTKATDKRATPNITGPKKVLSTN
jgi:hypothetical protein